MGSKGKRQNRPLAQDDQDGKQRLEIELETDWHSR